MRKRERHQTPRVGRGPSRIGAGVDPRLGPPREAVHQSTRGPLSRGDFGFRKWIRAGHRDRAKSEAYGALFEPIREGHLALEYGGPGEYDYWQCGEGAPSGRSCNSS